MPYSGGDIPRCLRTERRTSLPAFRHRGYIHWARAREVRSVGQISFVFPI